MMRVTTNSMVRNYNSSLSESLSTLNSSRERVSTGRLFNRAYQDPSGAQRASELQRKYLKIEDHLSTVKEAQSRQDSADGALQQIVKMASDVVGDDALRAITGTSDFATRQTYATSLKEMQQTLLQSANAKYGSTYLFAGADGGNLPFSMNEDGNVTYRGIDVTTGMKTVNGVEVDCSDELEELKNEKLYFDVGLGLQIDGTGIAGSSSDINGASAYDASTPGIRCFGSGQVEGSGDPPISKNMIVLVGQLSKALTEKDFDKERFGQMMDQLTKTNSDMMDFNAEIGVKSKFLSTTETRLKTDKISIYTQLDSVRGIDPAEAITDYSYSQYAYNMVLKVGSSLLTSSFIDFMK